MIGELLQYPDCGLIIEKVIVGCLQPAWGYGNALLNSWLKTIMATAAWWVYTKLQFDSHCIFIVEHKPQELTMVVSSPCITSTWINLPHQFLFHLHFPDSHSPSQLLLNPSPANASPPPPSSVQFPCCLLLYFTYRKKLPSRVVKNSCFKRWTSKM